MREEMEEKGGELLLPQERRNYPRVAMTVYVVYRLLDEREEDKAILKHMDAEKIFQEYKKEEAVNLSSSGILMYTSEEMPVKCFVSISMYIPLPGLSCKCRALAEVVRSERAGDKYLTALKFVKVLWHDLNKYKYITLTDILNMKGDNIKLG